MENEKPEDQTQHRLVAQFLLKHFGSCNVPAAEWQNTGGVIKWLESLAQGKLLVIAIPEAPAEEGKPELKAVPKKDKDAPTANN